MIVLGVGFLALGVWCACRACLYIEHLLKTEYRPPFTTLRGPEYVTPTEATTQLADGKVSLAGTSFTETAARTGIMVVGTAGTGKSPAHAAKDSSTVSPVYVCIQMSRLFAAVDRPW